MFAETLVTCSGCCRPALPIASIEPGDKQVLAVGDGCAQAYHATGELMVLQVTCNDRAIRKACRALMILMCGRW